MPRASKSRRLRTLGCLALGAACGCAWWNPAPLPQPTVVPPRVTAGLDVELDAAIAHAMPEVSYQSQNPAMTDPLGREDPTVILPDIETLDGEGKIVCRKHARHVFGRCLFPPPAPAAP
jgi:hypothetical protein